MSAVFTLAHTAHYQGANIIAAAGKITRGYDRHPFLLAADLEEMRRAHAAIGAALAEYDRVTIHVASERSAA